MGLKSICGGQNVTIKGIFCNNVVKDFNKINSQQEVTYTIINMKAKVLSNQPLD